MNHSDTPNTIFDSSCKSGVRTTARIKAGEEVTANYKETEEILKREIEDYHYYNQQTQEK